MRFRWHREDYVTFAVTPGALFTTTRALGCWGGGGWLGTKYVAQFWPIGRGSLLAYTNDVCSVSFMEEHCSTTMSCVYHFITVIYVFWVSNALDRKSPNPNFNLWLPIVRRMSERSNAAAKKSASKLPLKGVERSRSAVSVSDDRAHAHTIVRVRRASSLTHSTRDH